MQHIDMKGKFETTKEKNVLVGVLNQNFLIFIMETENFSRLLFQQIAVNRPRTHHNNLLFQSGPLMRRHLILRFRRGNLMIQWNKAEVRTLSGDQVITKVKRQADPDHRDQILPNNISLLYESFHTPNESQTIPRVKQ